MKNIALSIFLGLIIFSCTSDKESNSEQNEMEQTPEALNNKSKIDISSYGKRYESDIIQKLFEEAIENNEKLKSLTSDLENFRENKSDSLKQYYDYTRINQKYWDALEQYSNQLSDSTMQMELSILINGLIEKQSQRTTHLDQIIAKIDSSEQNLKDLETLMKIFITSSMMSNYQRNELPNQDVLESIKKDIDGLINRVKPYTKIQK